MKITIRGSNDETLLSIKEVLHAYGERHPDAEVDLYRQNSFSMRIRVIDPSFAGLEKYERHEKIGEFLGKLPEEIQGDISMIVLLAPGEEGRSMANLEFEDPAPSIVP